MRNFFKYFGISAILVFSFYYTEKINDVVITNSKLFNEIKNNTENYEEEFVNAKIEGDYIIPGLNGTIVDVFDSYYNMKELNTFNINSLSYESVTPAISITDNKDKIINRGNEYRRIVGILLKNNKNIIDYSYSKNIKFSRLVDINTYDPNYNYEQINNETKYFNKLDNKLNKKRNTNICVIDNNNENICRSNNKYLVKETVRLNSYNVSEIKKSISNGVIIYIDDDATIADYKILLNQIYYNDIEPVWLSTLINEERD